MIRNMFVAVAVMLIPCAVYSGDDIRVDDTRVMDLDAFGLADMQVLSDFDGMKVRGKRSSARIRLSASSASGVNTRRRSMSSSGSSAVSGRVRSFSTTPTSSGYIISGTTGGAFSYAR